LYIFVQRHCKLNMKIKILVSILLTILALNTQGQTVYEPTYKSVYSFLSRIAQRGEIELNDVVQPIARKEVAAYLYRLNKKNLTKLEEKELEYYLKDYTYEIRMLYADSLVSEEAGLSLFTLEENDRPRLLSSQSKKFTTNVQPILGYDYTSGSNSTSFGTFRAGFWAHGYIGKNVGYSLDYRTNIVKGEGIDYERTFTPEPGVIGEKKRNGDFVYTDIRASIAYDWDWGTLSLAKDKMPFGYGSSGKMILSEKAPTFPLIRLDVRPLKWLAFNYAHLWLNSEIVDSSRIRYSGYGNRYQVNMVPKKMAVHSFILTPLKGLSILIGESIIYNDEMKLSYLIPVNFFRSSTVGEGERAGVTTLSNSQVFFQVSSRNHIPRTHLYTSWYIDDVYHKKGADRRQYAFNVGASFTDVLIENLTLTADYARIYPYAYSHHMNTLTYQHSGYNLGHWAGTNSDVFKAHARYRIMRGLEVQATYQKVRKGSEGEQGEQLNAVNIPFLWGDKREFSQFVFTGSYELTADMFVKGFFDTGLDKKSNYSLGISYGF
jgi:hypothetical protein